MKKITLFLFLAVQFIGAQNYTEYFTGNPVDAQTNHEFGICMMGGASENDNAMIWFLNKANGGDVVVLRASGSDGYNDYFYTDLGVSLNSVTTFVINNVGGATDPYVLQRVANAEAIWFAGGDQYDYVTYFKDNAMEDTLNAFINTKGGAIGGTSAGMAILGGGYFSAENGTVTNAQALSDPYHSRMTLGYNDFLDIPMLEQVITDTHYDDPDRRGRHAAFLARYATDNGTEAFGIACEEFTSVCIEETGDAYVFGDFPSYQDYAYFLRSNCAANDSDLFPETCISGQPLTWNRGGEALQVSKIPGTPNGQFFVNVLEITSSYDTYWENWSVSNGSFLNTTSVDNPNCDTLTDKAFEIDTITVGPNPFYDRLDIETDLLNFSGSIYDTNGRVLLNFENDKNVDTSALSSGIYFLIIKSEASQASFKLIKN